MSYNYVEIPSSGIAAPPKRFPFIHTILAVVATATLTAFVLQAVKTRPTPSAPMAQFVTMPAAPIPQAPMPAAVVPRFETASRVPPPTMMIKADSLSPQAPMKMAMDVKPAEGIFVPNDQCETSNGVCSNHVAVGPGAFFLVKRFCRSGLTPAGCRCFGIKIQSADVPQVYHQTLTQDGVCMCMFRNNAPTRTTGWAMTMGCA